MAPRDIKKRGAQLVQDDAVYDAECKGGFSAVPLYTLWIGL